MNNPMKLFVVKHRASEALIGVYDSIYKAQRAIGKADGNYNESEWYGSCDLNGTVFWTSDYMIITTYLNGLRLNHDLSVL